MNIKACPVCGAKRFYYGARKTDRTLLNGLLSPRTIFFETYICSNCGLVMDFIREDDMEILEKIMRKHIYIAP